MAENKTQATEQDVDVYLASLEPLVRREEGAVLRELMQRLSGEPAKLWGPSIVGFGSIHYRYDSVREGDMPRIAFSPRKAQLVLYGLGGAERHPELLARLGKHTTGKGCVYLKKLTDADLGVLEELVKASLELSPRADR